MLSYGSLQKFSKIEQEGKETLYNDNYNDIDTIIINNVPKIKYHYQLDYVMINTCNLQPSYLDTYDLQS